MTTEETIDLDEVVRIVNEAGHAAYVEMTGGGTATIYASKRWAEYPGTVNGEPRMFPYPERRLTPGDPSGLDERYEVAAGPGWFDGPDYTEARASTVDFVVGPDDNGEVMPSECGGLDEGGVAALIISYLRGEVREPRTVSA